MLEIASPTGGAKEDGSGIDLSKFPNGPNG
jgi:hypothetical protein